MSAIATFNKCRLMPVNHTLSANSITVTPAPVSGYPKENLLDPMRTKLCKVSGGVAEYTIELSNNPWVEALMLTGLGYAPSVKFRLRNKTVNASWEADLNYDSGSTYLSAYPVSFGFGMAGFGEMGFGGYIPAGEAPYHRVVFPHYFGDVYADNFWKLNLSDSGGGDISLGVLGLCSLIEMTKNFINGWEIVPVDTTEMIETTAGDFTPGRAGTRYEIVRLKFKNIPDSEKWNIHNKLKNLGKGTPFFISLWPESDDAKETWTTIYGRLKSYSGMKSNGLNRSDFSIDIREMPGELP